MPSTQSVRAKQNQVLRYVITTSPSKAAGDLGVSPQTLNRFLRASPESIAKKPTGYQSVLKLSPKAIAEQNSIKLVPKVTGQRFIRLRHLPSTTSRVRKLNYAEATTSRRKDEEGNFIPVEEYNENREKQTERAIQGLAGRNATIIIADLDSGVIDRDEALRQLRLLWKLSGLSPKLADKYLKEHYDDSG